MPRQTVASFIAVVAAVVMLGLTVRVMRARGAPGHAKTIASRTGFSPQESEQALLLLAKARNELPAGARVVFVNDRKPEKAAVNYAVAVGQLPAQHVLPAAELDQAEYLVVLHGSEGGEIVRRR
jgi:hypothetical protein